MFSLSPCNKISVVNLFFCALITLGNFISFKTNAQEKNLIFKKYTATDGLKGDLVNCFAEDKNGFIWIGTSEGLSRFDGREFLHFAKNGKSANEISGNVITSLYIDTTQTMWIATRDGGLCKMNLSAKKFTPIKCEANIKNQPININCIKVSPGGRLFIANEKNKLMYIDIYDSNNQFIKVYEKDVNTCYTIFPINNEFIYSSGINGGLVIVRNNTSNYVEQFNDKKKTFGGNTITAIVKDNNSNIWCGSWDNALHLFDTLGNKKASYIFNNQTELNGESDEISCLTWIDQNHIWLGTKLGELMEFDTQTKKFKKLNARNLKTSRVLSLFFDSKQRVWIGMNNGMMVYDRYAQKFEIVNLPNDAENNSLIAYCFFQLNDSTLWIGTSKGIVQETNGKQILVPVLYKNKLQAVHSIIRDGKDRIIIGTQGSLLILDQKDFSVSTLRKMYIHSLTDIGSTRVNTMALCKISNREFLLCSFYGYFNPLVDLDSSISRPLALKSKQKLENLMRKIFVDSRSNIWLLGATYGIMKADSITVALKTQNGLYASEFGYPINNVDFAKLFANNYNSYYLEGLHYAAASDTSILQTINDTYDMVENDDGSFYVSTLGGGGYLFNPENLKNIFQPIETSGKSVQGLAKDNDGNLWLITGGRIGLYDKSTNTTHIYDIEDGLPTEGISGYFFKDKHGILYACGQGFYVKTNPSNFKSKPDKFPFYFTHLKLFDTDADSLLAQAKPGIHQQYNSLTFTFSYLDYVNGGTIKYLYKVAGMNDEWIDNGNSNKINITNLKSGDYTLIVRAAYRDANEPAGEISYTFKVIPYWYLTWWFYFLCFAVAGGGGYLLYMYRLKQVRKFYEMRNNIARDLHDDVGAALSSILIGTQLMEGLVPRENEKQHKIIDAMKSASSQTISNMSDIVWSLNPKNDTGLMMIEKMKKTIFELLEQKQIKVEFIYAPEFENVVIPMDVRKNIFLIFKEAIHNISKYAYASEVRIDIAVDSKKLQLKISDNGKGFDNKYIQAGNGLENMKRRATEINAALEIDSAPNKGTKIILQCGITNIRDIKNQK